MKVYALAAAAAVMFGGMAAAPAAEASPGCAHRSAVHVAEHGGHAADSRWHVAHGDLPTCDPDSSGARSSDDDDGDDGGRFRIPHRDRLGYHCKWLVFCG